MGVVIETCTKYPGGPTRNKGTDILNRWVQVVVSLLKPPHGGLEVKRPLRNRFGSETVTNL